ncbi:MAG: hypothetical protein LW884_09880 [Bacteroidetes bacterium]|jgi:hypothetical protein|nr:hypothetical protein [Bacteroidota bacterium]
MLRLSGFILAYVALALGCRAQWPGSVLDYQFGSSQTVGQDAAYFPQNVLGPITAPVGPSVPAISPSQVVSLGKGGHISLAFDPPIQNGPGVDFIVFENAFFFGPGNSQVYDEWMRVSVSTDGTTWVDFPYNAQTGEGLAGRTPTAAFGVDYSKPGESGGDGFDLALVGLDEVRYVRVQDATEYQPADRLSAELDGIAAVHQADTPTPRQQAAAGHARLTQGPQGYQLHLAPPGGLLTLYTQLGQVLHRQQLPAGLHPLAPQPLASGTYIVEVQAYGRAPFTKQIVNP